MSKVKLKFNNNVWREFYTGTIEKINVEWYGEDKDDKITLDSGIILDVNAISSICDIKRV